MAGPATGGALLAHTIAGLLDGRRSLTPSAVQLRAVSARSPSAGVHAADLLRRASCASKRVLLADDVRNTGKTFERCAELVREAGGEVVGIGRRSTIGSKPVVDLGVPNFALVEYPAPENYAAAELSAVQGR